MLQITLRNRHTRIIGLALLIVLLVVINLLVTNPSIVEAASGYRLPWTSSASYRVSQSWNGTTHTGLQDYAYDFSMVSGTVVRASRGGTVRYVKENTSACGTNTTANYIVINHSDGTATLYLHLKHNGSLVSQYQYVNRGDIIGYSGDSGTGCNNDHLHFARQDQGNVFTYTQSVYFEEYPTTVLKLNTSYTSQNTVCSICPNSSGEPTE